MDEKLSKLFKQYTGSKPEKVTRLTAAGSNRSYYRLADAKNCVIGVEGTSIDENIAFLEIDQTLRKNGLPVPEVLAVSEDKSCYLQQDLGDVSLFAALQPDRSAGIYSKASLSLLEKTIKLLPKMQFEGARGLDYKVCYPCQAFDRRSVLWDLNYFKYCFFKALGIEFHEDRLENDFEHLTAILLADEPFETFMMRDFQSRNVMVSGGEPWLIDFQGGRRGPVEYDLASFLWQARAAYPDELKEHLVDCYLEALKPYRKTDAKAFRTRLRHFILFRTLQTLGAYGYRGYFEHKTTFLESIPAAIANVRQLLESGSEEYPYLTGLLRQMTSLPQFQPKNSAALTDGKLTVRITSFSFRKGIPEDPTGNGGGFVFDCRGMHNPGRYDEYKQLNGTDDPVKEFLEKTGEVQLYLESVAGLIDPTIDKYLSRGFNSLCVSFGCTGGQHRSVYCAEHLALRLHRKYGSRIRIQIEHRELRLKGTLG